MIGFKVANNEFLTLEKSLIIREEVLSLHAQKRKSVLGASSYIVIGLSREILGLKFLSKKNQKVLYRNKKGFIFAPALRGKAQREAKKSS